MTALLTRMAISLALITAVIHPVQAQSRITPHNMMALCQGLGQAAATIAQGREQGVDDEDNEGVDVLKRLSHHSGADFLTPVSQFLDESEALPFLAQGMLYTHACWHIYQDNHAQITLMVSLLPLRCDINSPTMACINQTFLTLPRSPEYI